MSLYTSRQLAELVRPLDRPQQFLTTLFFPTARLFETRRIDFHILNMAREVAKFVHPDSAAKPVAERGSKIESFEPAYIKQLTPVTPSTMLDTLPGEIYGGEMSPLQRRALRVAQITLDHEAAIARRVEIMASTVLATGEVTVTGEDYPTQTVDFGRAADLTVALNGAARWGEADVSPQADLRAWAGRISAASGAAASVCVMGDESWELALEEESFRQKLDNRGQVPTQVQMMLESKGEDAWGSYQGRVGNIDYWTYSQPYAEDGVEKNVMDPHGVILGSPRQMMGVVGYGAILDMEALQAAVFWSKMFEQHNPSRLFIESASAPLPIPPRVNACFYGKVR